MKVNINDNPLRISNIPKRYKRSNGLIVDSYNTLTEFQTIYQM